MPWLGILTLLAQFFGPVVWDWIKSLFTGVEDVLPVLPMAPTKVAAEAAIGELFDHAIGEVPWYRFGKRRVLKACKRIAVNRAGDFFAALGSSKVSGVVMTAAESREVASAL